MLEAPSPMRKFFSFVAIFVALQMFPTAELLESTVHFVTTGHLAHAHPDKTHNAQGAEHACNGAFHACACHSSVGFTVQILQAPNTLLHTKLTLWQGTSDAVPQNHLTPLFRPPIV